MKTILKIIWGIFAVIGILSVVLFVNLRQKYGNFRLTVAIQCIDLAVFIRYR